MLPFSSTCLRSKLTRSWTAWKLEKVDFYNSNLGKKWNIPVTNAILKKLRLELDNIVKIVLTFKRVSGQTTGFQGVKTGIFGMIDSSATQWCQDVVLTLLFFPPFYP
jgi:hypothetical protein